MILEFTLFGEGDEKREESLTSEGQREGQTEAEGAELPFGILSCLQGCQRRTGREGRDGGRSPVGGKSRGGGLIFYLTCYKVVEKAYVGLEYGDAPTT